MIIYPTPVLSAPVISLPENYWYRLYPIHILLLVKLHSSSMILIVIPVECGWIHPVKEHHQQLFVSHLKYVHCSLNTVHQISANQVRVEEHLDSLSVTS